MTARRILRNIARAPLALILLVPLAVTWLMEQALTFFGIAVLVYGAEYARFAKEWLAGLMPRFERAPKQPDEHDLSAQWRATLVKSFGTEASERVEL